MVFGTCENVGGNFRMMGPLLDRICQFWRLAAPRGYEPLRAPET